MSEMKWIPVTERLPEESCKCLCANEMGDIVLAPYSNRYRAFNAIDDDEGDRWKFDYVTHWMPLPLPPETEKGGAE